MNDRIGKAPNSGSCAEIPVVDGGSLISILKSFSFEEVVSFPVQFRAGGGEVLDTAAEIFWRVP